MRCLRSSPWEDLTVSFRQSSSVFLAAEERYPHSPARYAGVSFSYFHTTPSFVEACPVVTSIVAKSNLAGSDRCGRFHHFPFESRLNGQTAWPQRSYRVARPISPLTNTSYTL